MRRAEEVRALCEDIAVGRVERNKGNLALKAEVASSLSTFCQKRTAETKQVREGLHQDNLARRAETKQVREGLHRGNLARRREMVDLLSDYGRYRSDIQKDLRKQLFQYRQQNQKEVAGLLSDINGFLAEIRVLTKERAGAVDNTLEDFKETRIKDSKETKVRLEKSCSERKEAVQQLLQGYGTERENCRQSWLALSAVKPEVPEQSGAKPEEAANKFVKYDFKAPAPEEPSAPVGTEEDLKGHIHAYIKSHPEGIRLKSIESEFNLPRIRAGNLTKALLNEGIIAKEGKLYVPAQNED